MRALGGAAAAVVVVVVSRAPSAGGSPDSAPGMTSPSATVVGLRSLRARGLRLLARGCLSEMLTPARASAASLTALFETGASPASSVSSSARGVRGPRGLRCCRRRRGDH